MRPETAIVASADKLRLRRALSITLMGLANLDAVGPDELHRKVTRVGAELDDALAHLDCCASPIAPQPGAHCRPEQRSSIVYLCTEIVAVAIAGIASRVAMTSIDAVAVRRALLSMSSLLIAKLQLLVGSWLKPAAPAKAAEDPPVEHADTAASPFRRILQELEPHLDVPVFARLRQAIVAGCRLAD